MGKPVTRMRGPRALLVVLSVVTSVSPAGAQGPIPEIVAPATRDVTPPGITPGPSGSGPLTREPPPPAPVQPPRWQRYFLPKTSDAATFQVKNRTIRIAGVTAPAPDATCRQASGNEWPCGRTALHSIRMFLRGRAIECLISHSNAAVEIVAPCRVGATDLGQWLLSHGWVRPNQFASDQYKKASEAARCARHGIWRGTILSKPCPKPSRG